jgi:hypothetical protein
MLASLPSQKKNILSGKLLLLRKKYKFMIFFSFCLPAAGEIWMIPACARRTAAFF